MAKSVTLDDKYLLDSGRIYLTGTQALVRLPMMQRQRDLAAGLNTAGYISGYRGSPLGGYDQALWQAKRFIKRNHIHFEPGVNEDLAATAMWGTQQIHLYPGAALRWRLRDVVRQGAGRRPLGRRPQARQLRGHVERTAASWRWPATTTWPSPRPCAHQSEPAFMAAGIPVLASRRRSRTISISAFMASRMSRYSRPVGRLQGASATPSNSSASVHVDRTGSRSRIPTDFACRPAAEHPLAGRLAGPGTASSSTSMPAALAYCARQPARPDDARPARARGFGIVTAGKSYLDVRQALDELGIDDAEADVSASRSTRSAWSGRSRPQGADRLRRGQARDPGRRGKARDDRAAAQGRAVQRPGRRRPVVVGKVDERGAALLPQSDGELDAATRSRSAIVARLGARVQLRRARRAQRFDALERQAQAGAAQRCRLGARPLFLLRLPAQHARPGAGRLDGAGRHRLPHLAQSAWTATPRPSRHMGARRHDLGRRQRPSPTRQHVFQNLGDGTYFHSGSLAIRHAVATNTTITYKILYNDAVAMTGGQPHDGKRPSPDDQPAGRVPKACSRIARGQRRAGQVSGRHGLRAGRHRPSPRPARRGAARPARIQGRVGADLRPDLRRREAPPPQARHLPRSRQARLHQPGGLRRLRRLLASSPTACRSTPVETEFGRKRAIDQSSCNKDFSCLNGFCPSFVTRRRRQARARARPPSRQRTRPSRRLPRRRPAVGRTTSPTASWSPASAAPACVTIGAILGMAAHIEGKGATVLDMPGMAQKGGAVSQPCAGRRHAASRCMPSAWGRRRERAARLRPRGQRQSRCAGQLCARPVTRDRQHAGNHHRRFHAPSRSRLPARTRCACRSRRRPAPMPATSSKPPGSPPA